MLTAAAPAAQAPAAGGCLGLGVLGFRRPLCLFEDGKGRWVSGFGVPKLFCLATSLLCLEGSWKALHPCSVNVSLSYAWWGGCRGPTTRGVGLSPLPGSAPSYCSPTLPCSCITHALVCRGPACMDSHERMLVQAGSHMGVFGHLAMSQAL